FVAGYYMSFATARRVMANLQIPDKGSPDDFLEYPINDWLAQNLRVKPKGLNVLAGAIALAGDKPKEDGILLMTKFIQTSRDDRYVQTVKEDSPKDSPRFLALKEWLIREGGAEEKEL
ncbi:hypothetical protein B0H14DRAFT_2264086, partial [Mycena olivaceomarginata]